MSSSETPPHDPLGPGPLVQEKWLRSRGRSAPVIRDLSPRPEEANDHSTQAKENAFRDYGGAGFRLEFTCQPSLQDRFSVKHRKDLAFQPGTAAWVSLNATREIRDWFVSNGPPCVVTGACHERVALPNVDSTILPVVFTRSISWPAQPRIGARQLHD